MKGTYKVYDKVQKEWIDLCRYFTTPEVKTVLKIEDGYLWSSDDGKTWECIGEVGIDNEYLEDNFVKKNNDDALTISVNGGSEVTLAKDEFKVDLNNNDTNITSVIKCQNNNGIPEAIIETTGYRGLSGDVYPKSTVYVGHTDNGSEIKLSVYDEDEYSNYQNELSISAFSGVKINGSDVITKDTVDESGILTTNEDGVVNKSELTIGSFEIKTDKPYNYTFEGTFYPYGPQLNNAKIVAEYDKNGSRLVNDTYCYTFVITEAKYEKWFEDEDSGDGHYEWVDYEEIIGRELYVNAAYLDSDYSCDGIELLKFTDDVSENTEMSVDEYGDDRIVGHFTRIAPYSLRYSSKALLNGSPVITRDTMLKLLQPLEARIAELESKIAALTNTSV